MDTLWSRILNSYPLKYNSVSSFGLILQNQIKVIVKKLKDPIFKQWFFSLHFYSSVWFLKC